MSWSGLSTNYALVNWLPVETWSDCESEKACTLRLSRSFRFVFMVLESGMGKAIAVGPHDTAYQAAVRA